MNRVITISPDIQSGEPVFSGTRVPVKNLFDYLKGGETLDDFLEGFPSVSREQVLELLSLAEHTFTFSEANVYEKSFA
ncbi:hypothetical protein BH10ACI3_BH10ACI3_17630 [soil metagenome]